MESGGRSDWPGNIYCGNGDRCRYGVGWHYELGVRHLMGTTRSGSIEARRHVCDKCGKEFIIPLVGKYPYTFYYKHKRYWFCGDHCKRIAEDGLGRRHYVCNT